MDPQSCEHQHKTGPRHFLPHISYESELFQNARDFPHTLHLSESFQPCFLFVRRRTEHKESALADFSFVSFALLGTPTTFARCPSEAQNVQALLTFPSASPQAAMDRFSDATLRQLTSPSVAVSPEAASEGAAQAKLAHSTSPIVTALALPVAARIMNRTPSRFTSFLGSTLSVRIGALLTLGGIMYDAYRTNSFYRKAGYNQTVSSQAALGSGFLSSLVAGASVGVASLLFARPASYICRNVFPARMAIPAAAGASLLSFAAAWASAITFSQIAEIQKANTGAIAIYTSAQKGKSAATPRASANESYSPPGAYLPEFPSLMLLEAAPRFPLPLAAADTMSPLFADVSSDLVGLRSKFYERPESARPASLYGDWAYATPAEAKYDARLNIADEPAPVTAETAPALAASAADLVKRFYKSE